jgi:hypothetical protein
MKIRYNLIFSLIFLSLNAVAQVVITGSEFVGPQSDDSGRLLDGSIEEKYSLLMNGINARTLKCNLGPASISDLTHLYNLIVLETFASFSNQKISAPENKICHKYQPSNLVECLFGELEIYYLKLVLDDPRFEEFFIKENGLSKEIAQETIKFYRQISSMTPVEK